MRFLLLLWAATVFAQTDPAETQIREARKASNAALQQHDIKPFAATLDADFVAIRGNGVLIPSRQAYIEIIEHDFVDPKAVRFERITEKVELSAAAPLAAEHGHWIGTRPDGAKAFGGTYLAMWRNTGSGWKLRSELFVLLACYDAPSCAGYRKP